MILSEGVTREAFEALSASCAGPKVLYRGDCRGCGECCGRFLPMSRVDVARLVTYVRAHGVVPRPERDGAVDLTCPLLGEGRECMAYEARPDICRAYRCDLHAAGAVAPPPLWRSMRVLDMREVLAEAQDRKDGRARIGKAIDD